MAVRRLLVLCVVPLVVSLLQSSKPVNCQSETESRAILQQTINKIYKFLTVVKNVQRIKKIGKDIVGLLCKASVTKVVQFKILKLVAAKTKKLVEKIIKNWLKRVKKVKFKKLLIDIINGKLKFSKSNKKKKKMKKLMTKKSSAVVNKMKKMKRKVKNVLTNNLSPIDLFNGGAIFASLITLLFNFIPINLFGKLSFVVDDDDEEREEEEEEVWSEHRPEPWKEYERINDNTTDDEIVIRNSLSDDDGNLIPILLLGTFK